MNRALKQTLHARGAEVRLQLKEALAGLATKELQAQSVWTVEHLLQQDLQPQQLEGFVRDLFSALKECPPAVRRLRYRLAAHALKLHATKHWGQTLLHVRDKVIERIGHEENAESAQELQAVMQQLAGACIEAYCHGHFSSLGVASKEELPREWLCYLLIAPLLRAACRGPAKTKLGNGCLLVEGVLATFRKWQRSAAVLHSATECLKALLRLAGTVALTAGEVFLPLQSCICLLGLRLTGTAVQSILRMIISGMERREEWQVRKAATETLALLVGALVQQQRQSMHQDDEGSAAMAAAPDSGLAVVVAAQPQLLAAIEQHVRFDRIPQVRQAAVTELQRLAPASHGDTQAVVTLTEGLAAQQPRPRQSADGSAATATASASMGLPTKPGYADRHISNRQRCAGKPAHKPAGPLCTSANTSPTKFRSPPRFVRPQIPADQRSSLDFGVQLFAPKQVPPQEAAGEEGQMQRQQQQQQQHNRAGDLPTNGRASPQSIMHHVVHPLFRLQLQSDPPLLTVRAAHHASTALECGQQQGGAVLAAVSMRMEDLGHQSGAQLVVDIEAKPDRLGSALGTYRYFLQDGMLVEKASSNAGNACPGPEHGHVGSASQPLNASPDAAAEHHSYKPASAIPIPLPPGNTFGAVANGRDTTSSPTQLAQLATSGLPSFSPSRPAGRPSTDIGMDSPAKRWARTLRPLDAVAPLLPQPADSSRQEVEQLGSGPDIALGLPGLTRPHSPAHLSQPAQSHQVFSSRASPTRQQRRQSASAGTAAGGIPGGEAACGKESEPSSLEATTPARYQAWAAGTGQQLAEGDSPKAPSPSRPTASYGAPQRCVSPPYTPAMQQQGAAQPQQLEQQQKGPLTTMVTKALSRLQQLEDLHHWQESLNSQLSGGASRGSGMEQTSDASSVKPAGGALVPEPLSAAKQLLPELQAEGASQDEVAGQTGAHRAGQHFRRSAAEPALSAIPEASERSSSEQRQPAEGEGQWEPAAEMPAVEGGADCGQEQDSEMAHLLELQNKLQVSIHEVQKRIAGQTSSTIMSEQGQLGDAGGSIGAVWPLASQNLLPEGIPAASSVGLHCRPDSRESAVSSQHYLQEAAETSVQDWMQHSNPLFNSSRPATALSEQLPLGFGYSELAAAHSLASQGLSRQVPLKEGRTGITSQPPQAYHDSFQPPPQAPQMALAGREPLDSGHAASPSLLSLGGRGGARSMHSLGSEFMVAGRETEEEVTQFLRGSIASPSQHEALPQQRQGRLAPALAAWAVGDRGAQQAFPDMEPVGKSTGSGEPPVPADAPQASTEADISQDATLRKERPRWAHLHHQVPSQQQEHQQEAQDPQPARRRHSRPSSPDRTQLAPQGPAARQAAVRGSLDLAALFGSYSNEPLPVSSAGSAGPSRLASPQAGGFPVGGDSPGAPAWQANSQVWGARQQATATLQRLQVSSRQNSPGVDTSIEEAVQGSISQVLHATFPDDALERLDRLRAQLSPTQRVRQADPAARNQGTSPARRHASLTISAAPSSPARPQPESAKQRAAGPFSATEQMQQAQLMCSEARTADGAAPASGGFVPRPASPLAPGLPISRRQASLVREVVGRQAGQAVHTAGLQSTADIRGALTEVLQRHTEELEAYYQRQQEQALALLKQQCGKNLGLLDQVMQREADVLKAASQQATRADMQGFVVHTLPRLAEVLASKELLLRCFEQLEDM
ncbi:hypothetical protein N2152v2_001742 [Parachlorella kessleri]